MIEPGVAAADGGVGGDHRGQASTSCAPGCARIDRRCLCDGARLGGDRAVSGRHAGPVGVAGATPGNRGRLLRGRTQLALVGAGHLHPRHAVLGTTSFIGILGHVALVPGGGLTWLQCELMLPLAMILIMLVLVLVPVLRGPGMISVQHPEPIEHGQA
ncbi:MAG: hypothetical protein MZW92_26985 [Comamonadaceae bacterium]|nr:hypothetical protein [Comamonadaceae bacterium]